MAHLLNRLLQTYPELARLAAQTHAQQHAQHGGSTPAPAVIDSLATLAGAVVLSEDKELRGFAPVFSAQQRFTVQNYSFIVQCCSVLQHAVLQYCVLAMHRIVYCVLRTVLRTVLQFGAGHGAVVLC